MKTELSRNAEGEVSFNGIAVGKIPLNQSILSMDFTNFQQGDDYTVDPLWVYRNGKPVRKQLERVSEMDSGIPPVQVWRPNLEDLAKLEARFQNCLESYNEFMDKWRAACKAIKVSGGKAHCQVTHEHDNGNGTIDPWWLWHTSEDSIGFDWVPTPEKPINLELGNHFYHLDRWHREVSGRLWKFRLALNKSFIIKLDETTGSNLGYFDYKAKKTFNGKTIRDGLQAKFEVNGREYWYIVSMNRNAVMFWEKVSWAEDNKVVIKI